MRRIPTRFWWRVIRNWFRWKPDPPMPDRDDDKEPTEMTDKWDKRLVELFNLRRRRMIIYDPRLDDAADLHSSRQAASDRMYHGNLFDAAENVAQTQSFDADRVYHLWMSSAPHRAAILNSAYTRVGFGCVQSASGRVYWTANFGR
jgi:hypothetical protein